MSATVPIEFCLVALLSCRSASDCKTPQKRSKERSKKHLSNFYSMLKIARQKNLMEAFAITGRSVLDIARLLFHPHVKMSP